MSIIPPEKHRSLVFCAIRSNSMVDGEEEDPFDVFGESDDDASDDGSDSNEGVNNKSLAVAKSLIAAANNKSSLPTSGFRDASSKATTSLPNNIDRQLQDLSYLNEWENNWPDPMYKGKILLVSQLPVGGGRSYVAMESIEPGTLVLVESPMITWPEEQLGEKLGIVSVKHLIKHPDANQFVHDLEHFHPTKNEVDAYYNDKNGTLNEVNEEPEQVYKMIELLRLEHTSSTSGEKNEGRHNQQKAQELLELIELARQRGIRSQDGSVLNNVDIIRLLLILRYNGLESGVYRHVAMLNHDDNPNCAKFLPTNGRSFSEVRTTRFVQKGEMLTISYLPRIVSHASRRKVLWEQHRFDIGVKHLKGDRYKMELIGTGLPPSPIHGGFDEPTLTERIESTTEDLERMQAELENTSQLPHVISPESFETAKALEQTLLELYKASGEQLQNPVHILLVPILSLHVEICAFVLKDTSLKNSNQIGVLSRQTLSGYRLLPLQKALLGPDHFALARTSLDLAESISQLLSISPKYLYDLKLPSMNTFAAWSALEHKTRKEHNRIKTLYPHDVEKHITI